MSTKITVHYDNPADLQLVIQSLGAGVKSWKVARKQTGRYKRAYIDFAAKSDDGRRECSEDLLGKEIHHIRGPSEAEADGDRDAQVPAGY